jgi:hypothetical protein
MGERMESNEISALFQGYVYFLVLLISWFCLTFYFRLYNCFVARFTIISQNETGGICVTCIGSEIITRHFVCKNRNVRDHVLDMGVEGKII